jgi:hypothetical protein
MLGSVYTMKRVSQKKTSSVRSAPAAKSFKIVIVHPLGPFPSMGYVAQAKANIKSKVPHAVFSPVKKSSKGLILTTKTSYVQKVAATAAQIKAHLLQSAPRSKVSVTPR